VSNGIQRGLAGKVAIVTGGAGGLGSATARRLSAEGCRVVVVDIDGEGARKVAESLPEQSAWAAADVSGEEGVAGYLRAAMRSFGHIDLHHLNAGIPGTAGAFPDLTADEFDRVLAVNVRGIFLGLRGAFRAYRAQGSAGSVVLTASIASLSEEAAYMTGEVVSVDGGSAIVSTVRSSGGAGAWDFGALDERTYGEPDAEGSGT